MKLLVSLALILATSISLAAQQVAKAAPPVPINAGSANGPDPATHSTPALEMPKFVSAASGIEAASSVEAMMFTPTPLVLPEKPVFRKKLFMAEMAVYTVPNILDGITTVRGVRRGFTESSWPRGSAELLGTRPGIARYTATMGGLEVAVAFASYRLQHSQNRYLRLMGHSLMVEGVVDHTSGFVNNLMLPSRPGQ